MMRRIVLRRIAIFIFVVAMIGANNQTISNAQSITKLPDIVPPLAPINRNLQMKDLQTQAMTQEINNRQLKMQYQPKQEITPQSLSPIEKMFNNLVEKTNIDTYSDSNKTTNLNNILNKPATMQPETNPQAQQDQQPQQNQQALPESVPVTEVIVPPLKETTYLYQFGYDQFKKVLLNSSYELNRTLMPGDNVNLNIWGDTIDILLSSSSSINPSMPLVVDREGFLTIPAVGKIFVTGLTLNEAKQQIQSLFSSLYIGIETDLTLGQASSIPVYITGEVNAPGLVMVPTSATIIDALSLSGGIKKSGTLRNIVVKDKKGKIKAKVDLYEFLRGGKIFPATLNKNDTIFVENIGNVVAINGEVLNPAIYELKQDETGQDLINYAGGLLPSIDKNRVQIISYNLSENGKTVQNYTFSSIKSLLMASGDLLTFHKISDEFENAVEIMGNIKNQGLFNLTDNMKLSDLIEDKDNLLTETYDDIIEINREEGIGKNPKTFNLSLKKLMDGNEDVELKSRDVVTVFKSTTASRIKVSGSVSNPGYYTLEPQMTINDIIGLVNLVYPSEKMVCEVTKSDKSVAVIYLYDLLTLNESNFNYTIEPGDSLFFRLLKNSENIKTVTVLGYVNNPGVYKIRQDMVLADAINFAGGLTPYANLNGMVFARRNIKNDQSKILNKMIETLEADIIHNTIRYTGMKTGVSGDAIKAIVSSQQLMIDNLKKRSTELYGRLVIDTSKGLNENAILVKDGDIIFIPEKVDYIIVAGEVYNQTAILYDNQKTLKEYINAVGGYTNKASKKDAYIYKVNGTVISARQSKSKFYKASLEPGDAIVIPAKSKVPINALEMISNITDILARIGTSAYIITKI